MWWVRFEVLVPGLGFMGTEKAVSGLALIDLSPNEAEALREAGQEDHPVPTERAVREPGVWRMFLEEDRSARVLIEVVSNSLEGDRGQVALRVWRDHV